MKNLKTHLLTLLTALLVTLSTCMTAFADDTEVLVGAGGGDWPTPNVLFIIDTSGSMGYNLAGNTPTGSEKSRLTIVQETFSALMDKYSRPDSELKFNVAMMRFDSTDDANGNNTGGSFILPMQLLEPNTKNAIKTAANGLTSGAHTPLAESLYEAALFYRGDTVHFGNLATPTNVTTVLNPVVTTKYKSPITTQCGGNSIILLTDGEPTEDTEADSLIETLTGTTCTGNCLDELAGYLHDEDQSTLTGKQTIITSTIGLTTNQTLLEDTASAGGGAYMTASNATQLTSAFERALGRGVIEGTNSTFAPPAIAANAFNNVSHSNRLYFTLYEPAIDSSWNGNVKPYKLTGSPPRLTDARATTPPSAAINGQGIFDPASVSFWSARGAADGGSIVAGGANSQLPTANNRNLYTYTGSYSAAGVPTIPALTDTRNALKETSANTDLTPAMLGLDNTTSSDSVINATRNSTLNDPLHSKPALVTYGGTESVPDVTLFMATNGGFLHAINAGTVGSRADGEEIFGFIPKELLPNLDKQVNNSGAHPYGLDGDVTVWVKESDDVDHTIDTSNGSTDHVFVYVGMRRGGNNYYALDVTNREAPTLKWVIRGGAGGTDGFSELGQTWSRPEVTTIKYGTSTKTVLIFGGGYDTTQDANPFNRDDSVGRAVFIVDADTGEKLWQADSSVISTMTNSIPSDVKLLDSDFDGNTDRLYVGDMAGQIFRIDLQATATAMTGSGVRLANLGSAASGATAADNRRFYYPPDVVLTRNPTTGTDPYISVNIGSGYRAHPLNSIANGAVRVNDRFYSIRDPNVLGAAPGNFTAITSSDLFPATNDLEPTAAELTHGWYITLGNGNGEKVLAPSITLNGEIFFTTYTPPTSTITNDCKVLPGTGTVYRVSLFDATPPASYDAGGNLIAATAADRATTLARKGIPSSPTIMFREKTKDDGTFDGVGVVHCEGTECEELPDAIQIEETYWRD